MSAPVVSVVIPCHNQAHYLSDAIESVLAQTHPEVEVVVVDDGSRDNTAAVASRYADTALVLQRRHGPSAARNAGLARTRGAFVAFLDADDLLHPHALEVGLRELSSRPDAAFVTGHHRLVAADRTPLFESDLPCEETWTLANLLRRNSIGAIDAVLFRREALLRAGGFDPALHTAEDYDLYLRLLRHGPAHCHHTVVADCRLHGAQATRDPVQMLATTLAVVRAHSGPLGGAELRSAARAGRRFWRSHYGSRAAAATSALAHEGPWREATASLAALARHSPRTAAGALLGQRRRAG
jgi:hypothetical protein